MSIIGALLTLIPFLISVGLITIYQQKDVRDRVLTYIPQISNQTAFAIVCSQIGFVLLAATTHVLIAIAVAVGLYFWKNKSEFDALKNSAQNAINDARNRIR